MPRVSRRPIHPLRRALFERQQSTTDLAAATGYSPATIRNVMSGDRESWPKLRAAVAAALDCPESELFPEAAER